MITRTIMNWASHRPLAVMVLLVVISLVATVRLPGLSINVSSEGLLLRGDPEREFYDQTLKTFGSDDVTLIYLHDPDLFATGRLTALRDAIAVIEGLPFVERTESLFSVQDLKTVDGYLNKDPYLEHLPRNTAETRALLNRAHKNPFVSGVLLSEDGRTMAVAVYLRKSEGRRAGDEQITEALDQALAPLQGVFEEAYQIGFTYVRTRITGQLAREQARVMPLAVAVLLVTLGLTLRSVTGTVLPLLSAGLSVLWVLGFMAWTGIPVNVLTSTVPALLVIVGSTEDVHLLSEYQQARRDGLAAPDASKLMAERLGRAVLLTFITSYVGFLSIAVSEIQVLWQFAVVASTGLLFNFGITLVLVPALLALAHRTRPVSYQRSRQAPARHPTDAYWRFVAPRKHLILMALGVLVAVFAVGIPRIEINHNILDNFSEDSPVHQRMQALDRDLSGLSSFSIVLNSGIEDTFLKVRYLEELVKLQTYLEDHGIARTTTSFADYLSLLNSALAEDPKVQLPETDDVINEVMIFLQFQDVAAYVSPDYSRARIVVRHGELSTREIKQALESVDRFVKAGVDPGLSVHITGDSVLNSRAAAAIVWGQGESIALVLFIILLLIGILFADLKVGLLAVLPNLLPIVVLFGFMGFVDIPLNMGTAMIAAIAIGIAVDDTMHFMVRYNQELKRYPSQSSAIQQALRSEARPVLATSLSLAAGFSVFVASDFPPVAYFGLLSALVVLVALLADFMLTPILLSSLRLITIWDVLSADLRREVVEKSDLFNGMRRWEIRRLVAASEVMRFADGAVIFQEGESSSEMFLVLQGQVAIRTHRGAEESREVDHFSAGDIFGDIALLSGKPRQRDAVAVGEIVLLGLTWENIRNAIRFNPHAAARLFMNLAVRISRRYMKNILSERHRT